MKAVVIPGPGGPEVLQVIRRPDPEPAPGEVLVRVRATALNRADLLQRRGLYPAPPDAPQDIPGLEFAGEVLDGGTRLQPGDRVMGILGGGGHASRVRVHERLCLPVPDRLDWIEAAAIPEAFLTAYDALFRLGRLRAGERVLVQAAASGIGTAAAQLARAGDATVVGLSRTGSKRRRLAELGWREVLDPAREDVADAIREAAGGDVDVVLDMVGGPAWKLNVGVLAARGRMVVIGLLGGAKANVNLGVLLTKRITVVGSVLRSRSTGEKAELTADFSARMGPLLEDGRLRATVDRSFELEQAADAHAYMERNANLGKIVLTVGED